LAMATLSTLSTSFRNVVMIQTLVLTVTTSTLYLSAMGKWHLILGMTAKQNNSNSKNPGFFKYIGALEGFGICMVKGAP